MPSRPTSARPALAGAAAAALTMSIVLNPAACFSSARAQHHATSTALDSGSRAAVTAAWNSQWIPAAATRVTLSGGPASACKTFTTTARTQDRALASLNFARSLAGLDPVRSVTDSRSTAAKRSALIQAANDTLTHYPSQTMRCYSRSGAQAARQSNIGYLANTGPGWRPTVTAFVSQYLSDGGGANKQVFHRRWILRPQTTTMANQYARATHGVWHVVTNDLAVFPTSRDDKHATRPRFIAWPAAGYFPTQLEPGGRWSIGTGRAGISFKHARVKVTHNGKRMSTTTRTYVSAYPGDRTIVWQFKHKPARVTGSHVSLYKVTISHITGAHTHTYTVRLFHP